MEAKNIRMGKVMYFIDLFLVKYDAGNLIVARCWICPYVTKLPQRLFGLVVTISAIDTHRRCHYWYRSAR